MKKKVLIWIGAGALIASGLGAWTHVRGERTPGFRTATVDRGPIESTVSATGNLNAVVTVDVGSQVSGNIRELYADFNSRVKKGQVVARIDPEIFQARVTQAQANLEAAQAAVMNAQAAYQKANAAVANAQAMVAVAKAAAAKEKVNTGDAQIKNDRRVQLFNSGLISKEDRDSAQATFDAAKAAYDSANAQVQSASDNVHAAEAEREVAAMQIRTAQAQVKQMAAALQQAQIDLQHTYILAPVDGVVVSRKVDIGQTVAASLQAPTLFQIAQDLTKMQIDTSVDEADIGRIQVGQAAQFTVDAFPAQRFQGTVTAIRKAPINVQNVVTYDVIVAVSNPDLKLFPGMTANVKIQTDKRDNALRIPNAALRFRPPEAKPQNSNRAGGAWTRGARIADTQTQTVWIVGTNGRPQPVKVKTGISDGNYTEAVSGDLHEGDEIVIGLDSGTRSAKAQPFAGGGPRGGRMF